MNTALTKMPSTETSASLKCHICPRQYDMHVFERFTQFDRITSDCKPWSAGGTLAICPVCLTVQKPVTKGWLVETKNIYANYAVYHQADGIEQAVFDPTSGSTMTRSAKLIAQLIDNVDLPATGKLLDIGCGNGNFLRSFSSLLPNWRIEGQELSNRHFETVRAIKNVTAMHNCAIDQLMGHYHLISAIHVLEHIEQPRLFLEQLASMLNPDGMLFIEVPWHRDNPFELLVADHCSHFSPTTLTNLIRAAGFDVVLLSSSWVTKELSLVARYRHPTSRFSNSGDLTKTEDLACIKRIANGCVLWLDEISNSALEIAKKSSQFGVFGTSLGATWLTSVIKEDIKFFVDEDLNRAGRKYFTREIYCPKDVPTPADIFIALPPLIADKIAARTKRAGITYHLPPPLSIE